MILEDAQPLYSCSKMMNLRLDVKLDGLRVHFAFLVYFDMHEAFGVFGFSVISGFCAAAVSQHAAFEFLDELFMDVSRSVIVEVAGQLVGGKLRFDVGWLNRWQV